METPDMSGKPDLGEESQIVADEFQKLVQTIPKERGWMGDYLYKYQNFWCPAIALKAVVSSQKHFEAQDTDIILASPMKTGTTWLKALVFSICNRHVYKVKESPLLSCGPHELVPCLEFDVYMENESPNIANIASPRVFQTHIPYDALPASIRTSKCKIVYICRNPLDCFISHWHFLDKVRLEGIPVLPLEEAFEMFCQGIHLYGPLWDHVLGYWKASLETPDKMLFIKYEEMKKEPAIYTKMLAQFIGLPFNDEEEKEGLVDDIVRLCSFENLKNLEANKKGKRPSGAPNSSYFRKGNVGDWASHLKPNEAQRLMMIMEKKLEDSGLSFNIDLPLLQKEANV